MQPTKNYTDPLGDPNFRANMVAAMKQYGSKGLHVLKNGQHFCGGCGRILPIAAQQKVQYEPVFCQNCGRIVVSETDPLLPHFTTRFA